MRFVAFERGGKAGLAVETGGEFRGLTNDDPKFPGDLMQLLQAGGDALQNAGDVLAGGDPINLETVSFLPPIANSGKVICVGLNFVDHASEGGNVVPEYPALFARFNSSLIGHGAPIVLPQRSDKLDYEGELVAIIGEGGKDIPVEQALDHVAGYSIFNDASIRDYQLKSTQWTVGKNFDDTGAFGPAFVTADELPRGCLGLKLETRLNGEVMQSAVIDDMVFSVADLVSVISEAMALVPGDIIVAGTPSGVGFARTPPVYMKDGDVCEVEIDRIGVLSNPIRHEAKVAKAAA